MIKGVLSVHSKIVGKFIESIWCLNSQIGLWDYFQQRLKFNFINDILQNSYSYSTYSTEKEFSRSSGALIVNMWVSALLKND